MPLPYQNLIIWNMKRRTNDEETSNYEGHTGSQQSVI